MLLHYSSKFENVPTQNSWSLTSVDLECAMCNVQHSDLDTSNTSQRSIRRCYTVFSSISRVLFPSKRKLATSEHMFQKLSAILELLKREHVHFRCIPVSKRYELVLSLSSESRMQQIYAEPDNLQWFRDSSSMRASRLNLELSATCWLYVTV